MIMWVWWWLIAFCGLDIEQEGYNLVPVLLLYHGNMMVKKYIYTYTLPVKSFSLLFLLIKAAFKYRGKKNNIITI